MFADQKCKFAFQPRSIEFPLEAVRSITFSAVRWSVAAFMSSTCPFMTERSFSALHCCSEFSVREVKKKYESGVNGCQSAVNQ